MRDRLALQQPSSNAATRFFGLVAQSLAVDEFYGILGLWQRELFQLAVNIRERNRTPKVVQLLISNTMTMNFSYLKWFVQALTVIEPLVPLTVAVFFNVSNALVRMRATPPFG
jgi:hypothetical protein